VITYGMVGCYLADRQVRSYLTNGGWSLSGVALTGVFFTCAQMHFIDATTRGNGLMLFFDLIGIPPLFISYGSSTGAQRLRDGLEPSSAGRRRPPRQRALHHGAVSERSIDRQVCSILSRRETTKNVGCWHYFRTWSDVRLESGVSPPKRTPPTATEFMGSPPWRCFSD